MATGVRAYVTVFLFRDRRVLLMHRSEDRSFAPGLWTGVGGRVEPEEMDNLQAAAFREVWEEAGIARGEIRDLTLRAVLTQPEGGDIVLVVFFTGSTDRTGTGSCREGSLHWMGVERVGELEMIGNARRALEVAIRALETGEEGVRFGVCALDRRGRLQAFTFAQAGTPFL